MHKFKSQISVALVCGFLGFILAHQFKAFIKNDEILNASRNNNDIVAEIEQLKKEKASLQKKVEEQDSQLKNFEKSAAGKNEISQNLLQERDDNRTLLGLTDVEGEGVIVYINPVSNFINGTTNRISDMDLVYIVNELRFAGAEAISINDIRITGKSGIRNSSNFITINSEDRVSPNKKITIKAIGDKELLNSSLSFNETFSNFRDKADVKFEREDKIKINKYNKSYSNEYAKTVEENK